MLKEEGLDVNHFASAVKLKRVLDRKGSPKEELESLIKDIIVHSFQLEMDTKKFLSETGKTLQTTLDLEISISDVLVKISWMKTWLAVSDKSSKGENSVIQQIKG